MAPVFVLCVLAVFWSGLKGPCDAQGTSPRQPFALVHPVTDHTKLAVDEKGLAMLERLPGPIAPVFVIGPYRSGKSFLLNQLLGVRCDEGFGVGHTRLTQTKGVWMWGETVPVTRDGRTVNVLFFDTEGFESTGKADAYDDRVFALAALLSQVLIYNLPEAIRESDLEKLSFAVELSAALYVGEGVGREGGRWDQRAGSAPPPLRPGHMVWLIQRDFLQGKPLGSTLEDALRPVPNPHSDPAIQQLNRIRDSLGNLASNFTAVGLPQPHLDRTALCELGDEALAPDYLQKREALRQLVHSVAAPKVVQGVELDGAGLAALLRRVVGALNQREIPTGGSLVEYFNKELVATCREQFLSRLEQVKLPVDDADLAGQAQRAQQDTMATFERKRFGAAVEELRQALQAAMEKELAARQAANMYESSRVCERAESACEEALEREARQRIPSLGRFTAQYHKCKVKFDQQCVGPALTTNQERLQRAWRREEARFSTDYNTRLYSGLVLLSLVGIVAFRFLFRQHAVESGAWIAFIFLQVYPRTFLGEGSMYDSSWWKWLVWVWEGVVYNPLLDLGTWGVPLAALALVAYLGRGWYWGRVKGWAGRRCCGGRWWRRRRGHPKSDQERDLDV